MPVCADAVVKSALGTAGPVCREIEFTGIMIGFPAKVSDARVGEFHQKFVKATFTLHRNSARQADRIGKLDVIKMETLSSPPNSAAARATLPEAGPSGAAIGFQRLLSTSADNPDTISAPAAALKPEGIDDDVDDAPLTCVPLVPAQIPVAPGKIAFAIDAHTIGLGTNTSSVPAGTHTPSAQITEAPTGDLAETASTGSGAAQAMETGALAPTQVAPDAPAEPRMMQAAPARPTGAGDVAPAGSYSLSSLNSVLQEPAATVQTLPVQAEYDDAAPHASADQEIPILPAPSLPPRPYAKVAAASASPAPVDAVPVDAVLVDAVPMMATESNTGMEAYLPIAGSAPSLPSASPPAALIVPSSAPQHTSVVTATPDQIPILMEARLSEQRDGESQIVVQLDPPELGRVLIDFNFTSEGLQSVTVKGDSPEAMRVLRQMHFELVQALEQRGLSAGDLNFEQHTSSHRDQTHKANEPIRRFDQVSQSPTRISAPPSEVALKVTDRLDLRL